MTTRADRPLGQEVNTTPANFPEKVTIKGRLVTLEPLASSHADDLFACTGGPDSAYIWDYMYDVSSNRFAFIATRNFKHDTYITGPIL